MLKKCKVVMIPTNQKAQDGQIIKCNKSYSIQNLVGKINELAIKLHSGCVDEGYWDGQHLYILSDEKIKEGDWCYDTHPEAKVLINQWQDSYNEIESLIVYCKKIIATTDSILLTLDQMKLTELYNSNNKFGRFLPQPSQGFIEKFVKQYNKGNIITEVMVEYDDEPTFDGDWEKYSELHINPKDNTITIKPIKNTWTTEEVVELIRGIYDSEFSLSARFDIDEWIEKNL